MTVESVTNVIERERPDAILPTMGGQTGLNLAKSLAENGLLEKFGVELIGAKLRSINLAEDRLLFKNAIENVGLKCPASGTAKTVGEAVDVLNQIVRNFPVIIRPAFTLGGTGGGIAYDMDEFKQIVEKGLY